MSNRMGSVFSPDREQALWNCARECALRRMKRKCRNRFEDQECNDCALDIRQYGNFNPAEARLYMMQAQSNARELNSIGNGWNFAYILLVLIILSIVGCLIYNDYKVKQILGMPQDIPPSPLILNALDKVTIAMQSKTDMNNDGLINCIDAALVFYKVYPYRDNVRIIVNKHPDGRMHHLFNAVLIDGDWHFIEPQSAYKKQRKYWIGNVWGDKYDRKYNRDATDEYRRYLK